MPQGYGFLKYGRPMAAAAPLLLALSALPTTVHACTGNANDPVFCSQVNGQFVTGVGAFIDNNLSGVPGSSPIPGSTPTLDDDNDLGGDFTSPIDDDNDIDFVFIGEDEFTESGFIQTPLVYGGANQETLPAFDFSLAGAHPNITGSAGSPITTFPISGVPQIPSPGTPAPIEGATTHFYGIAPRDPGQGQFNLSLRPGAAGGGALVIVAPDGTVPPAIQTLVDQSEGTSGGSSGCEISIPACQAQVGNFYISVSSVMPSENVAPVLNALVNGTPATAPLSAGEAALVSTDGNPGDSAGLRFHYGTGGSASSGTSGASGTAGDTFVARQVASINKLRDEAANAPDPETRRQKQAELQRKESAIRRYGSAAVQNALGLGDASSAPVPGRN